MKFTVKRAGDLWLISRGGKPIVGLKSKAEATKRTKAMQKKAEEVGEDTESKKKTRKRSASRRKK